MLVTCFVKRFVRNLKGRVGCDECLEEELTVAKLNEAKLDWCKYEQSFIVKEKHFKKPKLALNLFCDGKGLYTSNVRVNHSKLKYFQEYSVSLGSNSYFTQLVILRHEDVHHCDLENTLNRIRCNHWVIKRRQTMKKIVSKCVICKVIPGKTLLPPSAAKLPDYRIYFEFPFEKVGPDYAGLLYTRDIIYKYYIQIKKQINPNILIFICAATHNTHLELVPTQSSKSLLLVLRRFATQKGLPSTFIKDNFKTFKAKEIKRFALKLKINWKFILEKSPYWNYKTMFEKGCWKSVFKLCRINNFINRN